MNPTNEPNSGTELLEGTFMVFDVESIGLHGEGYAVGFVVVTPDGRFVDEGRYACATSLAQGAREGRDWVKKNCPELRTTHRKPKEVRTAFWNKWKEWKGKGAKLIADCAWPVEAKFLAKCVSDEPSTRTWEGPYPLHDIASLLLAMGRDPLEKYPRQPDQLPEHDPLADARQSTQILCGVLSQIKRLKG